MVAQVSLLLALFTGTAVSSRFADRIADLAPLAERLGLQHAVQPAEDASFRAHHYQAWRKLQGELPSPAADREAISAVLSALQHTGQSPKELSQRTKSSFSTYRKMNRKNVPLSQIYDRLAVRVVVPEVAHCYALLHHTHQRFPIVEGEQDDYIINPKPSGYQALHTAIWVDTHEGRLPVELQLRTQQMHEAAERGSAAHWRYKQAV